MSGVAVVQPLPGIGDMIWHLPHIRAIARHVGAPVTLIAKPRSAADQIFAAEQTVADVFWMDRNPDRGVGGHDGSRGFLRMIRDLRARRFDAVYLLHHSRTIAAQLMAAGIPARFGYGFGPQRFLLNRRPFLPPEALLLHPFDQATAWLKLLGIALPEVEPALPVDPAKQDAVRDRLREPIGGLVAIGIGSSEPYKQWGARNFAILAQNLGAARIVVVGGKAEGDLAREIQSLAAPVPIDLAIGWNLGEIAALLALCDYYVGNDTGVMNMAAAVGARAYSLFGATPPFFHSSRIVPIVPPTGVDKATGMANILPDQVLRVIRSDRW